MTDKPTDWSTRRYRPDDAPGTLSPPATPTRLPQPGERHNTSSIPVSDLALAALLSLAQQAMALIACKVEDCENCNRHRLIWWDCCNALDKSTRISLQAWLNEEGYGLPEAPWEDVDPHGFPLPGNHAELGI